MPDENTNEGDPLRHADIGQTETIEGTVELYASDYWPREYWGSDRFGYPEIKNLEITHDKWGDEQLVISFSGEMTKRLPYRWDYSQQPRTPREHKQVRRAKWIRRAITYGPFTVILGIVMGITHHIMNSLSGTTIAAEPIQPPGIEFYAVFFAIVMILFIGLNSRVGPGSSNGGGW